MKKLFGFLMILSFLASAYLAENIPLCAVCFIICIALGAIVYRMEMRE